MPDTAQRLTYSFEALPAVKRSMIRRIMLADKMQRDARLREIELEMCRRDILHWFDNWLWTYNPKLAAPGEHGETKSAYLPFDLFERQRALVLWIDTLVRNHDEGLAEKSREVGFTFVICGYALHRWHFVPGFKTTFGSRITDLVDEIGNPDAIFEKLRIMLYRLPWWMRPLQFRDSYCKLINHDNGNVIGGEGGDEMGRGGRNSLYVVDEAAFIERAERVERAINANSDTRVWASTVNGTGNLFAKKRFGGSLREDQIFRLHWRDDPRKSEAWAEKTKNSFSDPAMWASEYEIDYAASVEGVCIPAAWVEAATRIASLMTIHRSLPGIGGGDVGGGKALSVFIGRFGAHVDMPVAWGDPDTTETALRMLDCAEQAGVSVLHFDSVGIGAGVASTLARNPKPQFRAVGINVGDTPSEDTIWPDGRSSRDTFTNVKAELWMIARERFRCTFEHVLHLENKPGGRPHDETEMISVPKHSKLISELSIPKRFRNERGKMMIETKVQLALRGISSPDHAEALVLTFAKPVMPGVIPVSKEMIAWARQHRRPGRLG